MRASVERPRLALAVCCLLLLLPGCTADTARPNILLVVLDDFGINDLSASSGSRATTPQLDAIAAAGLHFTRHYADAVCAPGRAALLTSRPAASVGFHTYRAGISPQLVTLPEQLRAGGYQTFFVGKWHLGHAFGSARPERQGFDHWFGMLEAVDTVEAQPDNGFLKVSYLDPWLEDETGARSQHRGHLTDLLAARASEYIAANPGPWFLQLSFLAPHNPVTPADRYARRYPPTAQGRYLALLEQVDAAIATVLDGLPDGGANTIVAITSDNGGSARQFDSNAPYAGSKGSYLEGGLRTPLLLYWKQHWEGGRKIERPVSIIDIAPTLLAAAGLEPAAGMQGQDLLQPGPARPLFWYQETLRTRQSAMLSADGEWRVISAGAGQPLLQARSDFHSETANRHDSEGARTAAMLSDLRQWLRDTTRVGLHSEPDEGQRWSHSGDDFRRTPSLGSYTIGVPLLAGDGAPGVLFEQPGYMRISIDAARQLQLVFDSYRASIPLPGQLDGCHSLAINAFLVKQRGRSSFRKQDSQIGVFLDGERIHSASFRNLAYAETSPATPLLTHSDQSRALFVPPGVAPVISTRRIDAAEVKATLHQELLGGCAE